MPMSTSTPSRNRRYPWSEWLDGKRRAIPVEQFDVTIESFRSAARAAARTRGLDVSVTKEYVNGRECVVVEAFGGALGEEVELERDDPDPDPSPAPGAHQPERL